MLSNKILEAQGKNTFVIKLESSLLYSNKNKKKCLLYTCLEILTTIILTLVTTREACEFFSYKKTATSLNQKSQIYYTTEKEKLSPLFGKTAFTLSLLNHFYRNLS